MVKAIHWTKYWVTGYLLIFTTCLPLCSMCKFLGYIINIELSLNEIHRLNHLKYFLVLVIVAIVS